MNSLLEFHGFEVQPSVLLDVKGDTQLAAAPGSKVSNEVIESFGRPNEGKRTKDQVIRSTYCERFG
jgi:hypothetical protein